MPAGASAGCHAHARPPHNVAATICAQSPPRSCQCCRPSFLWIHLPPHTRVCVRSQAGATAMPADGAYEIPGGVSSPMDGQVAASSYPCCTHAASQSTTLTTTLRAGAAPPTNAHHRTHDHRLRMHYLCIRLRSHAACTTVHLAVVGSTAIWPPSVRNLLRGDCAASAVDTRPSPAHPLPL